MSMIVRRMLNYRSYEAQRLAEVFGALSNPNRLSIFMRLASCCMPGGTCNTDAEMRACVGEVGRDLGIAPSTVSHHIKELHRAGLIRMERRGQTVMCWIDPQTLDWLSAFFKQPVPV